MPMPLSRTDTRHCDPVQFRRYLNLRAFAEAEMELHRIGQQVLQQLQHL